MTDDLPTGPEGGPPPPPPPPPAPAGPPPAGPPPAGPPPAVEPPTQVSTPTVAVPPVPPPFPPPTAPPGYPTGPPVPGQPVPPGYPAPPGGPVPPPLGPPGAPVAPPTTAPPAKGRRTGLVLGLLALVVVAIGAGVVAYMVSSGGSGSGLIATVDRCIIDADGTLTASGRLTNDGGDRQQARMTVVFNNSSGGSRVDRSFVTVRVGGGSSAAWRATGNAGDSVQRVTCVVTDVSAG